MVYIITKGAKRPTASTYWEGTQGAKETRQSVGLDASKGNNGFQYFQEPPVGCLSILVADISGATTVDFKHFSC